VKFSTFDYPVPVHIAEQVRQLLAGKRRELDFTFTTQVNRHTVEPCAFCHEDVCACADESGWHYDAAVAVDATGQHWATLTEPHDCPESRRFREFLESPVEPEFGEEETQ
jgi:hypothetical protein